MMMRHVPDLIQSMIMRQYFLRFHVLSVSFYQIMSPGLNVARGLGMPVECVVNIWISQQLSWCSLVPSEFDNRWNCIPKQFRLLLLNTGFSGRWMKDVLLCYHFCQCVLMVCCSFGVNKSLNTASPQAEQ